MKNSIKLLSILLLIFLSLSTNAANQEVQILQNQSKTIYLNMAGAFTASSVSVTGIGVTAKIVKKYPSKVKIKLTAGHAATGGLHTIKVRLAAGINKTPLYIYGIKHYPYKVTGPSKVGYFQKVEVTMPASVGKLFVYSNNCIGSLEGKTTFGNYKQAWYPQKRTATKRIFWITTTDNRANKTTCSISLKEESTMKKKLSSWARTFRIEFNKDNTMPTHFNSPQLTTADCASSSTRNTRGNSPRLKWNNITSANYYEIQYIRHHPRNKVPGANISRGWSKKLITNNSALSNLRIGSYDWCIIAGRRSPSNSILRAPKSDCSIVRTFTIKRR